MVSNKNNWNLQKIQTMHTILIIEDEPRVASLLKNGLEENGYQTMIAYDGVMGLRLFRVHTFDLVISDIILPTKETAFVLCILGFFFHIVYHRIIAISIRIVA